MDIHYLKIRLRYLVLKEEFEKAAVIRDWIKELEERKEINGDKVKKRYKK